ncbi:group II intron reverse transcriptase/maturase [Paenibacillus odorifer]|uniref:group II intron reverse transcriptase/maturase n=1 Tax=Paenibacillus TaxID=44249 RepID=UPI00096DF223|nr:group II intron reverse transcriptase/maturase [Paenibacillus odorifer]OME30613.1 group II intron reverse transcriptase/maturase [Paenibacillus odorifer]
MRVPNTIQTEKELRETLDLLFAHSKKGKSFTGILELVSNDQTIITAIHNIKSNTGAKTAGVDGKNVDHFLQMPYEEVILLVRDALNDYKPLPVRRVHIPKRNGKKRPLGIPAFIDRVVQECIRIVIEPILEARFYDHSYGFRPYRSTEHAIARVARMVNSNSQWAIEGDIKSFFDNVNHRLLIRKLERLGIIDKRILAIIKKMLKSGIMEKGIFIESTTGTPQGGILSPLLANAYLNDFDWTIARMFHIPSFSDQYSTISNAQRVLRKKGISPKFITRYADDWIIQTPSEVEASRLYRWLIKYFNHRLKLELSEEKTLITDVSQQPVKFLGFHIKSEVRKGINGLSKIAVAKTYPEPERVKQQVQSLREQIRYIARRRDDRLRAIEIENLNSRIVGIAEYWKMGASKRILKKIDNLVSTMVYFQFKKVYKKSLYEHYVALHMLSNRVNRHFSDAKGKPITRTDKTWAVKINGLWIGITKAYITPIQYARQYGQDLTPYSDRGRSLYLRIHEGKRLPLARQPLYNDEALYGSLFHKDPLHNFEFVMNREYAFNQTLRKGLYVCQICTCELVKGEKECHHKNPKLPLDQVNKVSNLLWMCTEDHRYIEYGIPDEVTLKKSRRDKIIKFRKIRLGSDGPI